MSSMFYTSVPLYVTDKAVKIVYTRIRILHCMCAADLQMMEFMSNINTFLIVFFFLPDKYVRMLVVNIRCIFLLATAYRSYTEKKRKQLKSFA